MRKLYGWAGIAAVALTMVFPAEGMGQYAQTRQGFWLGVGLGYGSLGCPECDGREGGLSGGLALGGTISQKLLLGVSSNGWTKEEGGARLTASSLTAMARFYPSATAGFFLVGGLGLGVIDLSFSTPFGTISGNETGAAALLGLGYDFRVGQNVSLSPFWNGIGLYYEDGDANFGQFGLALTIH